MNETKIYRIELRLGGVTVKEFIQLSLIQSFSEHHRLEVHIPAFVFNEGDINGFVNLKDLTNKYVGEKANLLIKEGNTDISGNFKGEKDFSFTGITTSIQLQKHDAINTVIVVTVLSSTILLDTGELTRSFTAKSLTSVVNELIKPFGGNMQSIVSPEFKSSIPYIVQYQEDNYHFLQRLAETFGEWCYYNGSKLVFGKSAVQGGKMSELEYGSNLTQMEYALQLVPMTAKALYYDYFTNAKYESSSSDECINGLQDYAKTALSKSEKVFSTDTLNISYHSHQNSSSIKQAVRTKKNEASNQLAICKGLSSSLDLRIGELVKIKDDIMENSRKIRTDDYGVFLVTSIRHYVDAHGLYQNSFEAIPQDINFPPVNYHVFPPKAESQPAKVIAVGDSKEDDGNNMGRVKVQFYWQKDGETTPWIRVASLMSGMKQGVYFVPEVDEVVFVDFEFGNPDLPFVRGSMYHGSVLPGDKLSQKENNFKGIITRGGNHIIIDDSGGKEEIRIYNRDNKNEVTLSLSGEPHISVKSEGKIKLEGKEIELKAQKITMTADQDWKVETQQGSIQSKSSLKVEAANINMEAKAQASLKANGLLALESSGQAVLKGAVVMIN